MKLQAILLLILGAINYARSCSATNPITATSGTITKSALWKGEDCVHSWIFPNIPNNTTMLVINITRAPLLNDVIKLNGEDFVDDDKLKYCKILEMETRKLQSNSNTREIIHKEFPGCKLRSGVRPGVKLTYVAPKGSFGPTDFVIEYRTVRSFSDPQPTPKPVVVPATSATFVSKDIQTGVALKTGMTTDTTTKTTNDVPLTSKLAIILGTVGGIIFALVVLLTISFIVRKRRTKSDVSKNDNQLNNFYQAIPENSSNGDTNVQIYNEISPPGINRKDTGDITQHRGNVTRQESAKDVINPLYEAQISGKHSYEYIEVRNPRSKQREERSAM